MSRAILENKKSNTYSENGIIYPSNSVMLDLVNLKKVYPTPKGDYIVLEHLNLQIMKEEFGSNFEIHEFTKPEDFKKLMIESMSKSITS